MSNLLEQAVIEYHAGGIPLSDLEQLRVLSEGDASRFRRYAQRRLFHEPLAYIARKTTFFGREFFVDPRVYVPNPETEDLVRKVCEETQSGKLVVDIGTGCGNIAITLKKDLILKSWVLTSTLAP